MLKTTKLRVNTTKKNQNLIDLLAKTSRGKDKSTKEKTPFDSDQTTSSNHLLPTPKLRRFSSGIQIYPFIQKSLSIKYNLTPYEFNLIELENIIQSKYCCVLAAFKEKLMFNFREEFLKRYYKKSESKPRILKCVDYYKNYLTFFCKPIFCELKLNDIIQYHGEKKAKIYYSNNFKDKEHNSDPNREKNKDIDRKNNRTIFTTTLKGNISMNSCLSVSQSINLIDYNHVDTKALIQNPSNFVNRSTILTMYDIITEMAHYSNRNANSNNTNANANDNKIKVNKDFSKPKMKKMFLMQKAKNQIVSIDKTHLIKEKNTLGIYRVISPKGMRNDQISDYICNTESNRRQSRNMPLRAQKENELLFLYNKTEVIKNNKKPLLQKAGTGTAIGIGIANDNNKLINKIKFKGNYNIGHSKNSYSSQMTTLSNRGNKDLVVKKTYTFKKPSIDYSNGRKSKYTLKVKPTEFNEKTSRNVKSDLEKGYFTIENEHRKSAQIIKEEEVKLPLFKTINVKRKDNNSNKKVNNYIIKK